MIAPVRVLLIYSNRSRIIEPVPPIGLCYVASATRDAGHDVQLLDMMVSRDPMAELTKALESFDPQVVGISIRNIDTVIPQRLSWDLGEIPGLIAAIRRAGNRPIVLGGSAVSAIKEDALRHLDGDFAIIGEGEVAFPKLLHSLENKIPCSGIEGLCFRADGKIHRNPSRRENSFGPSRMQDWIRWREYDRAGGPFSIHTKRGCPMHCLYCNYPAMEGREFRLREAGDVVDEIEKVKKDCGPRTFEFTDTTFNLPAGHAISICEEIIRRNLKVTLSAVGVNPLGVTGGLLGLMKRAGFVSMVISADSASSTMLKNLQKGFSVDDVRRTAKSVRGSGIFSTWFFLFGGPGETCDTVGETLAFVEEELNDRRCLTIAMTGIRILPGTPMAQQLIGQGLLPEEPDLTRPAFYFSPGLSERWVLDRIQESIARCPTIVHGSEEKGSSAEKFFYRALHLLGVAPPYIRFLPYFLRLPLVSTLRARASLAPGSEPGLFLRTSSAR